MSDIDVRYDRKFRTLQTKRVRTLYLDCEFCGSSRALTHEEQQEFIAKLKNPLDFVKIDCACGRMQWILSQRPARRLI